MRLDKNKEILKFQELVFEYLNPQKRIALSSRFPNLKPLLIQMRIILTKVKNMFLYIIASQKLPYMKYILYRHQSVLKRRLGDSNIRLQEQKIINLKIACKSLDGLVIYPGEVFSLWEVIGKPTQSKGYVKGMLLSNGKILEGMGGGLCQLSNFLCWIFLHANIKIIERYHHSMDVFPDSGRILPFGSGATCLYNFVDFKFKNISNYPIQLKIGVTERHLKGQLLSPNKIRQKYSLKEHSHCFIKYKNMYFRYNQIYRELKEEGIIQENQLLFTNFAPVLYSIPTNYFINNNYKLIDIEK